jgi:hypothetical protein
MKRIFLEPDFNAWREAAREALHAGYLPSQLDLEDASQSTTLALEVEELPAGPAFPSPHTSKAFMDDAAIAAVHRNPARWNLLYRILYRLQTDRNLLQLQADPDVAELDRLVAQVRRDIQKMHAFVRFRKVLKPGELILSDHRPEVLDEPIPPSELPSPPAPNQPERHHLVLATPTPFGINRTEIEQCDPPASSEEECEHFIAWYQPDHRILPLVAPFFAERFAIMRWTILTPDAGVSWNPISKQLAFAPGLPRESAPDEDELEALWRIYYTRINSLARP